MIELKNQQLTICIAEKGAELQSIKDSDGREYMWQAGPQWPRHSPILFPIVCSVNNNTYVVDGKEYHLPRHGFARDTEFLVMSHCSTDKRVSLFLRDSEETHEVYPFGFELIVTYELVGNRIVITWRVNNIDEQEIHFQIGGHPAFNMPGGKLKGRIELDEEGPINTLKTYPDGTIEMVEVPLDAYKGVMIIDEEFFLNDSVKIHNCQTSRAILLDTNGEPSVTVDYCTPVCAFWSPYGKQAPFVCIEPWYGIGDPIGFKGEFKDKPLMNHLLPGASFEGGYSISIR